MGSVEKVNTNYLGGAHPPGSDTCTVKQMLHLIWRTPGFTSELACTLTLTMFVAPVIAT